MSKAARHWYLPIGFQPDRWALPAAFQSRGWKPPTNLEFSRRGAIFVDDQMAAALIDCVVHHGLLLQFRGESYRVRHALTQGLARSEKTLKQGEQTAQFPLTQ